MKELSIVEKAKAYDEAIEKAIALHKAAEPMSGCNVIIETLFPKLKESKESKDEKIRKTILSHFKSLKQWACGNGVSKEDCIAYLEKQCERKPTKVEPKFKVGDWIVQGCNILKIRCVGDEYYCFETVGGYVDDMLISEIDSSYHIWTIEDAKDGDVLACESGWTCIFKKLNHNSFGEILFDSHCFIDRTEWFCDGVKGHTLNERINGKIYPATKEQRDLFFQRMKEACYEWNAEKKELKQI